MIGQGPYGFIQAAFQRPVALAKANADTSAEVFFLVDLRADKFETGAVFLAQKPEVGFHRIGHDHIGPSIHQIEIQGFIGIV